MSAATPAPSIAGARSAPMSFTAGTDGQLGFSGPADADRPTRTTYSYPGLVAGRHDVPMTPYRAAVLDQFLRYAMPVLGAPNATSDTRAGARDVRIVIDPDTTVIGDEVRWVLAAGTTAAATVSGHILTAIGYIHQPA